MDKNCSGLSSPPNFSTSLPADRNIITDDNDLYFQPVLGASFLGSEMKVEDISSIVLDDEYRSGFTSNSSNGIDNLRDIW